MKSGDFDALVPLIVVLILSGLTIFVFLVSGKEKEMSRIQIGALPNLLPGLR